MRVRGMQTTSSACRHHNVANTHACAIRSVPGGRSIPPSSYRNSPRARSTMNHRTDLNALGGGSICCPFVAERIYIHAQTRPRAHDTIAANSTFITRRAHATNARQTREEYIYLFTCSPARRSTWPLSPAHLAVGRSSSERHLNDSVQRERHRNEHNKRYASQDVLEESMGLHKLIQISRDQPAHAYLTR